MAKIAGRSAATLLGILGCAFKPDALHQLAGGVQFEEQYSLKP
jgi:hypothetical protein